MDANNTIEYQIKILKHSYENSVKKHYAEIVFNMNISQQDLKVDFESCIFYFKMK